MKAKLGLAVTAAVLGVALALAVTACGGGDDSDGVASLTDTASQTSTGGSSGSGSVSPEERREAELDYARCMREHGVNLPDPVNGRFDLRSNRGEAQKVERAQEACRHILAAVAPRLTEEQKAEQREAALAFARCMREHGVETFVDPTFKDGGVLQMMPEGAEDDPQFDEAQRECQPILNRAERQASSGQGQ